MNLTTQLKEAQAAIADLQSKADAAQALTDELATVKASLEDATAQITAKDAELAELQGLIEELAAEKASLISEVEALNAAAKSVDEAASAIVAGLGMTQTPEVSAEPVAKTRDEVIAEYLKLSGKAAGKFFKENKSVILGQE